MQNLSTDGFMAETDLALEPGAIVWLKLPGLEPQNSKVVWAEDGKTGFQFATPLHPATIELIVAMNRKPLPKGHFGPQDQQRRAAAEMTPAEAARPADRIRESGAA